MNGVRSRYKVPVATALHMPNMLQISSCKIGGTAVPSSSTPSSFPERASNPRLLRAAAEAEFKRRRNPTGNLQIHGAGKAPPTPPVIVHADYNFVAVREPEILPPPPPPQPVIPEPSSCCRQHSPRRS